MYDVTGVNVFPPKVNGIPPQRKGVKHPSSTTKGYKWQGFNMRRKGPSGTKV